MPAEQGVPANGAGEGLKISVDLADHLHDVAEEERAKLGPIVVQAVEAAVKAAIPAIVQAVKDVCMTAMRQELNPHLLKMQFKTDELDQSSRRDNLRITGLPEAADEEEEEDLIQKVCNVAEQAGVHLQEHDISSCQRLGKKSENKVRQTLVRFTARRKRDTLYKSRFNLKGKDSCKGVYLNEDLTPMRFKLLMAAKDSSQVQRALTNNGTVVCKMKDSEEFKYISTADDLFDIGMDDVDYKLFKLHLLQ